MKNQSVLSLAVLLTLTFGACDSADKAGVQDHVRNGEDQGLVGVVKNGSLINFQSKSIGNAFDTYSHLTKKEWKTGQLSTGHMTVDFTGWLGSRLRDDKDRQNGITDRGLEVKFVFNLDGSFYLFTIFALDLKSDGTVDRAQLTDISGILANIYGDKKIDL